VFEFKNVNMNKTTHRFQISKKFKEQIENFSKEKGKSISDITDCLLYDYWKEKVKLNWEKVDNTIEVDVCITLHPVNWNNAVEYRKSQATHTSMKWVFIVLWQKLLKGEIKL